MENYFVLKFNFFSFKNFRDHTEYTSLPSKRSEANDERESERIFHNAVRADMSVFVSLRVMPNDFFMHF